MAGEAPHAGPGPSGADPKTPASKAAPPEPKPRPGPSPAGSPAAPEPPKKRRRAQSTRAVFQGVEVVDAPAGRVREPRDLVSLIFAALGVVVLLALSVFAHETTTGVTDDIRNIASPVAQILDMVVSVLMNLATLLMPAAVIAAALFRRQLLFALQGALAGVGGLVLAWASAQLISATGWKELIGGLATISEDGYQIALAPLVALMAGVLTAMGPRSRRPVVAVSWNTLWVATAAWVLTGGAPLPAAIITVLLGRVAGLAIRYGIGVNTDRAAGDALVEGIKGAGLEPVRVVRVRDVSEGENPTERLDVKAIRDGTYKPPGEGQANDDAQSAVSDSTALALERHSGNRVYAVYAADGARWDAIVLDGDKQVWGALQASWRTLRLRGVDRRSVVSLRQAAERAALLDYAAAAAGVRTPRLLGVGEAADSMLLLQEHTAHLRSTDDMRPAEISDEALVDVWRQLDRAHRAGLAHRSITAASLLFGPGKGADQEVWLIGWEDGDVASSELARSMDCAQLLATLALKVGPARTVAAGRMVLEDTYLAGLAGLLQSVVFPTATRELAKANKDVIDSTRQELSDLLPAETATVPFQLVRFGWRTVLIAAMTLIAIWAVVTKLNFNQMVEAVGQANPWWMAVSFGFALVSYVGAAMLMVGFLPGRVPFWRAVLSQVAGSFTQISAPGALGPLALSLRFLNRRGVRTSLAVATIALTQVVLVVVTLLLLIGSSLVTGDIGVLENLPTTGLLIVAGVLAAAGCPLLVPPLRAWIWNKVGPTFKQVWPRLVWVLGRPKRLVFGLAGAAIQFGTFVLAFWAALMSFGLTDIPLSAIGLVYLIGNTAGSAAPTPGGLGGVEIALTAALRAAGVATATAASAALLFRLITYWARVPLGWVAFRYLAKRGDL